MPGPDRGLERAVGEQAVKPHGHAETGKHVQQQEHENVVPAQQAVPQLPGNEEHAEDRNRRHDPRDHPITSLADHGSTSSYTTATDTDTTAQSKRHRRTQIGHNPTSTELGEPHVGVSQQPLIASPCRGQIGSDRTIDWPRGSRAHYRGPDHPDRLVAWSGRRDGSASEAELRRRFRRDHDGELNDAIRCCKPTTHTPISRRQHGHTPTAGNRRPICERAACGPFLGALGAPG